MKRRKSVSTLLEILDYRRVGGAFVFEQVSVVSTLLEILGLVFLVLVGF